MKFNKFIKFLSLALAICFIAVGCEQDLSADSQLSDTYVGLTRVNNNINLLEDETVTIEAKVFAAKAFNFDRVLELAIILSSPQNTTAAPNAVPVTTADPQYYSAPTSVTILAGQTEATFQVTATGTALGAGKNIVIAIVPKEGIDLDTRSFNTLVNPTYEIQSSRLVLRLRPICGLNPLRIAITLDRWGSESSWELYDSNLVLVEDGGPYVNGPTNALRPQAPIDLCLPDGNYTFVMYDSYGDGMIPGFYTLNQMNPTWSAVVTQIAQNGEFGASDVVEFSLPALP